MELFGIGLTVVSTIIWSYILYLHFKDRNKVVGLPPGVENRLIQLERENKGLYENMGSFETLLSSKEKDLFSATEKVKELEAKLLKEEENSRIILSQKKSSEIRTGHIAEQLAPFLTGFNHDPRNIRYLGQPIDYVIFDTDSIIFLEVKSGKSHLSHNQKRIRRLVEERKIRWEEFRVRGANEWKTRKQFKKFQRNSGNGS